MDGEPEFESEPYMRRSPAYARHPATRHIHDSKNEPTSLKHTGGELQVAWLC